MVLLCTPLCICCRSLSPQRRTHTYTRTQTVFVYHCGIWCWRLYGTPAITTDTHCAITMSYNPFLGKEGAGTPASPWQQEQQQQDPFAPQSQQSQVYNPFAGQTPQTLQQQQHMQNLQLQRRQQEQQEHSKVAPVVPSSFGRFPHENMHA